MRVRISAGTSGLTLIISMIILMLASAMTVSAIGVSPAKYSTYLNPDNDLIYSFWLVNKEKNNLTVDMSVKGELSPYITIHNSSIILNDTEELKEAYFTMHHPLSLGKPGPHTAEFMFSDSSSGNAEQARGSIEVIPTVNAIFEVIAPYPGKYIESGFNIESRNSKQPVYFIFPVSNHGQEDIESIYAVIEIYHPDGRLMNTIQSDKIPLDSKKSTQLRASQQGLSNGRYNAKAELFYDDKNLIFEKPFDYGEWKVILTDLRVEKFKIGDFTIFNFTLSNNWNIDAEEVQADITITNNQDYFYTTASSINTIPANSSAEFEAYWDTSLDVDIGEYYFTIEIYYSNYSKRKIERFNLEENRIITKYYTPTLDIKEKVMTKSNIQKFKTISFIILILIISIIAFFVLMKGLPYINRIINKSGKEDKMKDDTKPEKLHKISVQEKTKTIKPEKIRKNFVILEKCKTNIKKIFSKVIGLISCVKIIDKFKSHKRINQLKSNKRKYRLAIEKARSDLIVLKNAIEGLKSEMERGIITKDTFNKRMDILTEGKSIEYWEDYYANLIVSFEEKIKEITKEIWSGG